MKQCEVKFEYAISLDTGKPIHISEVKRGLDCDCQCVLCGGTMLARKGEVNQHHFAHFDENAKCNAQEANETALHKMGKEILEEEHRICLPQYIVKAERDDEHNRKDKKQQKDYVAFEEKVFEYEKATVEQKQEKYRPDVILHSQDEELYVEICVTHAVDETKRKWFHQNKKSCIEIDLLKFSQGEFDRKKLRQEIIQQVENKKWISYKDDEKAVQELKARNRSLQKEWEEKQKEKDKENEQFWAQIRGVNNSSNVQELDINNIESEKIRALVKKLNDEQLLPVLNTDGAVLVLAGAGSGKTRVLTTRIAYLIEEKGVPADAILAITFTNKAANEMKERLSQIVDVSRSWVCTIHSMCVRILRMYAAEVGINSNFSIYSETERNNIIKKSFQECDFDDEKLLKNIKWHIANAKMLGLDPEQYAEENAGERQIDEITKVYTRYQKHLRENNALDFDDLLNETRLLLKNNAEAREYLGGRFRYILVDEFQDTNAVQYEICSLLASVHGNLFAVGDDDQSIYGWRGAKIENILHFEKDFKNAKVFKLERNYRSTKEILNLANTVIKNNGNRKDKTLWTENADGEKAKVQESEEESSEARFVAHTIAGLMRQGYQYSDFAILMRVNALTRSFEQEFTGDGIPYKVFGGFKFFERKEIKDLLAYLRLINNPFDSEAAVRIINFPKRGIGAKTVEALQNYAYENELSVYDALLDLDEIGLTAGAKQKLVEFRSLVKEWIIESQDMPVNELVKKIIEDTKMREAYADESDESINKRANIDEFINAVEEYCRLNEGATLMDYLNQVTLSSDTDEMDDGNYVTLATIHAVKGLEFKCVFICGLEENMLPISRAVDNDDDMEEERRLMYVAITRAKERLFMTRSKSRYLYGKREPTMRSRFLKELSPVLDLPRETSRMPFGYDGYDDPESYGNSAYGGGRYATNDDFGGRKTSFGGGYGSSYGGSSYGGNSYGNSSYNNARSNSGVTRTAWNGGSSYGGSTYGGSSYGNGSYGGSSYGNSSGATYGGTAHKAGGAKSSFTYGGISRGTSKPTAPAGKDLSAFRIGVKVKHPKFGEGTIVNVRGVGNNMIADIAFEGFGIKQLSASLAPLTILG